MNNEHVCNSYFDYYSVKINKDPRFLDNIKPMNSYDSPRTLSSPLSWHSQAPGLSFYAFKTCIIKVLQITAAYNTVNEHKILNTTCSFVNSQWLITLTLEENCLDKINFGTAGKKYEGSLRNVCAECKSKLCLKIFHRKFNYLDKSCILTKNKHHNFGDVTFDFV